MHTTRSRPKLVVSADGNGVVHHAGSRLLADLADATTLTSAFSDALHRLRPRGTGHDPGRVAVDLAVMLADGGEAIADLAVLRDQPAVFGAGDRVEAQVTPLLERIDAYERELGAAAEQLRAQIDELTTRLRELGGELGNLAVARKTLLALPSTTPEPTALPTHPAYRQILDAFSDAGGPMRARDLCERLDLAVTPKNIESTRHKLKRLVGLGQCPDCVGLEVSAEIAAGKGPGVDLGLGGRLGQ